MSTMESVRSLLLRQPGLTEGNLREQSGLGRRTIYSALFRLQKDGLTLRIRDRTDGRRTHYYLKEGPASAPYRSRKCATCPFQPMGKAVVVNPPERAARLAMLAASGIPVQCHYHIDPGLAAQAQAAGKDWRPAL